MGKPKIVSVEQLRSHLEPLQRTVMWHGIAMTVRTLLPMEEVIPFVDSVMNACYDNTHGVVIPEMLDFAFRVNTIERYAFVDLPQDIKEQYELLYGTDIFDTIIGFVNKAQLKSLRDAVESMMFTNK